MPTQWAHGLFWPRRASGAPAPPRPVAPGGYPAWQAAITTVTTGSLLGGLQVAWERCAWWATWMRRLWRWDATSRACADRRIDQWVASDARMTVEGAAIVAHVCTLLEDPVYCEARKAVKLTATTLGFNKPNAWAVLGHQLRARPHWAENQWRHLHAMAQIDLATDGWSNPDRNLIVELAYLGFALHPEKKTMP